MTTLGSRVTPDNYAEVLRLAEQELMQAEQRHAKLKAVSDRRLNRDAHLQGDHGVFSGTRRRTTASQAKREEATQNRDFEAAKATQRAEEEMERCRYRVDRLRKATPVPYTTEEMEAARCVRTAHDGWMLVERVNKVTVSTKTPYGPLKVKRDQVLEVRGPNTTA